jgi:hypothetical protein
LYSASDDDKIKASTIRAIFAIGSITGYRFLATLFREAEPAIKANILGDFQFIVGNPIHAEWVDSQLLPELHKCCSYAQQDCLYFEEWGGEEDYRFWVFRCLGQIKNAASAPVIEEFISATAWPLTTLAEAANAHWDITHTDKYISLLRQAKAAGLAANTEHAIKEIETYQRKQKAKESKRSKHQTKRKVRRSKRSAGGG